MLRFQPEHADVVNREKERWTVYRIVNLKHSDVEVILLNKEIASFPSTVLVCVILSEMMTLLKCDKDGHFGKMVLAQTNIIHSK